MSVLDDLFPQAQQSAQPQVVQLVQAPAEPAKPEPEGLAKYGDLWKMPEGYKPPEEFDPSKLHDMKPEDFQKAVSQLDFTQGVTPELLQKVASGGEEAVQALGPILRGVAQSVYANSTLTTTRLIENALSKSAPAIDNKIKTSLRSHEVNRALSEANPLFSDPATASLLGPLKEQLIAKYPDASPSELVTMAKEFLATLAGAVVPQNNSQQVLGAGGQAKATDWEAYFEQPVRRG